jgi:hypothetical protein
MNPTTISFHTNSIIRSKIRNSVGTEMQLEALKVEEDNPQRKSAEANVSPLSIKCSVKDDTDQM